MIDIYIKEEKLPIIQPKFMFWDFSLYLYVYLIL